MQKKIWHRIIIAGIIAFFLSLFFSINLLSNIQFKLSDGFYGGKTAREDIIIIAIDDKSLQEIGRWPWDRDDFADMINQLEDAKVVGIDVAFFEESYPDEDKALVEAVKQAGNVVLPVEYTSYKRSGNDLIGDEILKPIDGIEENALGLGYINVITDKDGVSRAVNLNIKGDYDSFAAEIYKHYTGEDFPRKESRLLVNFVGKPFSFQHYSFSDVWENEDDFEDKLVLIGATSPDLHDEAFVPTSSGKAMPGVEIHANTLQTMLERDYLNNQSILSGIIFIILSCIIAVLVAYFFNAGTGHSVNMFSP